MPYQILVTTTKASSLGVSIHTLAVPFDTSRAALVAAGKINHNDTSYTGIVQTALCLFDVPKEE